MKNITTLLIMVASLAQITLGETPTGKDSRYVAKVIGKDVYIRSGNGMNFYRCGKISEPTPVVVVAEKNGWSMIEPPKGSFSWISMRYVDKDPSDPTLGIVKGDNVRVWTGSPYVPPLHSQSMQVKLNTGDKVKFITPDGSRDEGGYYCIEPPKNAYLWINSSYLKKLGPLSMFTPSKDEPKNEKPIYIESKQPVTKVAEIPAKQEVSKDGAVAPVKETAVKAPLSEETTSIAKIAQLTELINKELKKPLLSQNFDNIKAELEKIVANKKAGKASRFAQFRISEIQRYQTAKLAALETIKQDTELTDKMKKIQSNLEKTLVNMPKTSTYTIEGNLFLSSVYSAKTSQTRYIIKNNAGRIIAYATPVGNLKNKNLSHLIGKRVGLTGTQSADPLTPLVLVKFDKISLIK